MSGKPKPVKVDRAALERYVSLEQRIHEEESKNTLKALSLKEEQLTDLDASVKQKQLNYDMAVKQTDKEKKDVDQLKEQSVRNFIGDFDKQMSKEQEEYLDALNKQEIAKKELDGATAQRDAVKGEMDKLKKEAEGINALYKEQDELLAGIFNGAYGSDNEYKLETQLDVLLDKKQRVQVAHYKWTNARVLLGHAVTQLHFAVRKWDETMKVPAGQNQQKYTLATETRNNLIAATQNLNSCQKYLSNIDFPYVKPQEVTTLTRATEHIYTDMQTPDRASHAMQCYSVTQKRSAALMQWIENVVTNTISKDLKASTTEANSLEMALRQERLRLIKLKIQEADGSTNVTVQGENDLGNEARPVNNVAVLSAGVEQVSIAKSDESRTQAGTPLPLSELAPAPSGDELFGALDNIKKEHEQQQQEFEKAQAVNKARMEQGLQEKLRARRSRQTRQS